ncbi:MAG: glycosyl hydrolase family 28-related protein [Verrucomicrobiota bacterium]|nr:right-handed parallel beta-helix repeat-containing protein [Verrucomicrobiota bacterium]
MRLKVFGSATWLSLWFVLAANAGTRGWYDVTEFGAKGDGLTINTAAINTAIEQAVKNGGGTIFFPAGNFLSYSIRLQNNISLYLDQGAVLIAAKEVDGVGYDDPEPNTPFDAYQDFGHNHWKNSLIWGIGLHDISIHGAGMIWGRDLTHANRAVKGAGDKAIGLKLCRNVSIKDISILHGGHFGILATGVDNLTLSNLRIDTDCDGFDVDCCKNVRIDDCTVNSPFDDAICLKSSLALGYPRATENVTIANCQVSGYELGSLLDGTFKRTYKEFQPNACPNGRIKLGTESTGGFKNITIANCIFDFSFGLALETVDGAPLEDVSISNLTMREIVDCPIFIRLGARMRAPAGTPMSTCRRINISNVVVHNAYHKYGCIISGLPGHNIEDLELSNIQIHYAGGGTKEMANRQVEEYAKAYPEPEDFGIMPAYGFFFRHVKHLKVHDVKVAFVNDEQRPPFVLDDVEDATFHHVASQKAAGSPGFQLNCVKDVTLHQCQGTEDVVIPTAQKKAL